MGFYRDCLFKDKTTYFLKHHEINGLADCYNTQEQGKLRLSLQETSTRFKNESGDFMEFAYENATPEIDIFDCFLSTV